MTRRPSILLQLSGEYTEQVLNTTRLPLQMLGNREEIKPLLLETTDYTYLITFLSFYKWMNKCLPGNDCGLLFFPQLVFLFLLPFLV